MTAKYYKKETVIYRFKHDILIGYADASQAHKEKLWEVYLMSLRKLRRISRHQAKTWVYPKKELT